MEREKSASKLFRMLVILAPSVALSALVALAPALANIARAFPELSDVAVQNLYTIPYLVAFPLIYFSGFLASVFTKKQIIIVSLLVMIVGSCLPLFCHDSYAMLIVASVVIGAGYGAVSPITSALINEHCPPEQQAKMLGIQAAVIGLSGVIFAFLGGILADIRWWLTYAALFLLVPVLVLTLYLPKGIVAPKLNSKEKVISGKLVYILCFGILLQAFTNMFQTNISMLLEEFGHGGAGVAGVVTAFQSLAGILGGLLTGIFIAKTGRYVLPAISLISAVSMFFLWKGGWIPALLIGCFVLGAICSARVPAGYMLATEAGPPGQGTKMISLYCCCTQLGVFLSPHLVELISPGEAVAPRFLASGFALIVLGVMGIVKGKMEK